MYPQDDVLLTRREVERRTGLSRSTIYRKRKEGTFPEPVHVYPYVLRWRERGITAWIQSHLAQSDGAA